MSIFSASRGVSTAALFIGGLGFAGALAGSTAASADAQGETCKRAFARNKTAIEMLAKKPNAEAAISRLMAKSGCAGTNVSVNRVASGDDKNMRIRIRCSFTYPPATLGCQMTI